jgi:hypothetical protein
VPSGQWTITSWSAQGGPGAGREALVVFRPTGTPNQYLVVGATSPQTLANTQNTFSADIKVEGGDLIGFWAQAGTRCAHMTGSTADSIGICLPELGPCSATTVPDRNDTLTVTPVPEGGFRLNMSVVLKSRPSSSGNNPAPSPVVEPEPARIAICTVQPIKRTDGTIGTFADVLASEYPATDPASPYYGSVPAKYAEGIGLTCDNLPGYTDAGYKVNGDGVRAPAGLEASWPAPYEYYTKNA